MSRGLGYADGVAPQMPQGTGINAAAQQVQSMGRGQDTLLAHISPDEAAFIDHLQGGRRTNPLTGLPEYGLFGSILKTVARIAGAVGGFMVGGPLGAAAGAGAATKLTGGSWKDALKGAALAGVGAGVGNLGQGGSLMGGAPSGSALAGGASTAAATAVPSGTTIALGAAPAAAPTIAAATPGFFSNVAAGLGGYGGLGSGFGTLIAGPDEERDQGAPAPKPSGIHLGDVTPNNRKPIQFTGDYAHYGEPGYGGEHLFFDNVNPPPQYTEPPKPFGDGGLYADGGPVHRPGLGSADIQTYLSNWRMGNSDPGLMAPSAIPTRTLSPPTPAPPTQSTPIPGIGYSGPSPQSTTIPGIGYSGRIPYQIDTTPINRVQQRFTGDYAHYGEPGGGSGHMFFNNVNPVPPAPTKDTAVSHLAGGGPVFGLMQPPLTQRGARAGGMEMPKVPMGGADALTAPGLGAHAGDLRRAAILGYANATVPTMPGMARGGRVNPPSPAAMIGVIKGPGGPTDDLIDARLSDGEHVFDSRTVSLAGQGNNDKGQRVIEGLKQEIRRQGGAKNVKKPPTAMMVARAKKRAGVK